MTPKKNSKAMIRRATKTEDFQPKKVVATILYSKGSIGKSLNQAEAIKTKPMITLKR